MNTFFRLLSSVTSNAGDSSSGSGATDKMTDALKNMVKSPIFYIVIGAIVLLIIVFYLVRRIVSPRQDAVIVVVRKGNIHKLVEQNSSKYFLVPFIDHVGAIIPLNEQEFTSDKLFINNGPDYLYKINFTLAYKVNDPKEFYKYSSNIQELLIKKLNDDLREYADNGNALTLIKDYRTKNNEILSVINKAISQYNIEATSYKVNLIEPLGKK